MNRTASLGFVGLLAGCLDQTLQSSAPLPAIMRAAELQHALETQPSGTAVTWQSAADGQFGTVTPVRTFRTPNGYCREYLVTLRGPDGVNSTWRDIACRDAAGVWRAFEAGA
jgi:surface antigen